MKYEIDYMSVGTGEKGGDAIALRYGNFNQASEQHVVVIDGGTKESGQALVTHIKKYYNPTRTPQSTHQRGGKPSNHKGNAERRFFYFSNKVCASVGVW